MVLFLYFTIRTFSRLNPKINILSKNCT